MKRIKDYKLPEFSLYNAYSLADVSLVLGISTKTIYRNNPNSIFSRSRKYKNKRYFERNRIIEYQEKQFFYCSSWLYEPIEGDVIRLLPSGNRFFLYEFENCMIEVDVSVQDKILTINKLLIYNKLYDIIKANGIIMGIYENIAKRHF